jgi:hypothetical protein
MVWLVTSRSRNPDIDDPPTLIAVGVLAATLAAVAHEALGHGGACLAEGGAVTLLTSIYFHCRGAGDLTDAAGPLGSLAFGAAALAALRLVARASATQRLFLTTCAAIGLFWFFGQLARDAALAVDDWAFAARRAPLGWALAALGVLGYAVSVRLLAEPTRALAAGARRATLRRLLVPWVAAVASAVLAGALWRGDRLGGAWEGVVALGVAPLGYLLDVRRAARTAGPAPAAIPRSWPWILAAAAAYATFALTQGLGIGPLA